MKHKTLLIALFFCAGIGVSLSPAQAAVEISLQPSQTTLPAAGSTFAVNVQISGVTNLAAFEFNVNYNPDTVYINTGGDASVGAFLGQSGRNTTPLGPIIDNGAGSLKIGAFSFGTAAGVTGTGTLAQITFTVKSPVAGTLTIENALLTDTNADTIPVNMISNAQLLTGGVQANPEQPAQESGGGAGDTGGCFIESLGNASAGENEPSRSPICVALLLIILAAACFLMRTKQPFQPAPNRYGDFS